MSDWNEEDHPRDDDGKFSSGGGGGDAGGGEGESGGADQSSEGRGGPSREGRLTVARERHAAAEKSATEAKRNRERAAESVEEKRKDAAAKIATQRQAVERAAEEARTLERECRERLTQAAAENKQARQELRRVEKEKDDAYDEFVGRQQDDDDDETSERTNREWDAREAAFDERISDIERRVDESEALRDSLKEHARELKKEGRQDQNLERLDGLSRAIEAGDLDKAEALVERSPTPRVEATAAYLADRDFVGDESATLGERLDAKEVYEAQLMAERGYGDGVEAIDLDGVREANDELRSAEMALRRRERAARAHEREVKRIEKAIDRDGDGRTNEEERGLTEADRAETTNIPLAQTKREIWKVEARAAKQLEVDLYDDIGGIALLGGGVTAGSVRAALKGQGEKDVLCRIHSAGGIVTEGLAIYNLFKQHRGKVVCRVDSLAGSIASVIAMAGDELEMAEHSYLMIHNPFGMVQGGASELRSQANLLESMREQMVDIYCAKSGRARDEIGKLMDDETWMTAREALAFGFANRVITDSGAKLAAHVDFSKFAKTPESMRPAASVRVSLGEIQITPTPGTSPQSIADAFQKALGELNTTNPTDAAPVAPETQEIPMAMTEEETKKLADLEAQNAALQAALDAEKGARATAEDALAKGKSKAAMDEEDDEDEEKTAAKAVVDACVAITGVKDIRKLEGAVMALGPRLHGAANAAAARKLQVSQLIASGKLLPAQKAWALKCKPEALEGYLDALGDAKVGPVGEELTPDDEAPEVTKARAATASTFDPTKIELSPSELAIVKQMGENDPKLSERMLADKRAKAEAEHRAKYGQPRA